MIVQVHPPADSSEGIEHWRDTVVRRCLGNVCTQWPTAGWGGESDYGHSFEEGWSKSPQVIVVARNLEPDMAGELVAELIRRRDVSFFFLI